MRGIDQLRADARRERDEILARLNDTAGRLAEVTKAHAAELEQLRTDAAREREESRGELRSRAERAELDPARAELARVRQGAGPAKPWLVAGGGVANPPGREPAALAWSRLRTLRADSSSVLAAIFPLTVLFATGLSGPILFAEDGRPGTRGFAGIRAPRPSA